MEVNKGGNFVSGSQGGGSYFRNAGGTPYDLSRFRDVLAKYNGQTGGEGGDGGPTFGLNSNPEEEQKKQLGGLDYAAAGLNELGNSISNMFGFQQKFDEAREAGDVIGSVASFIPTLPFGVIGSIPRGISSLYEGASGHDVKSANFEEGTMNADKLTWSQRAGALGSGLIDLAGAGAGGSGRALAGTAELIGNAAPAAKKIVDFMPTKGKGVFHRVAEESGKSKAVSNAVQFGADVGEEGGEEFVQSFFEDARDENLNSGSLGRALESGMWGALGGGIMSGSGIAMSELSDRINPQSSSTNVPTDMQQGQTAGGNNSQPFNFGMDTGYTPTANAYMKDKEFGSEVTKEAGAFALVSVPGEQGQNLNTVKAGIQEYRSMWDAADSEGRQYWSNLFNVGEDVITDILQEEDAVAVNGMNRLLNNVPRNGNRVTVVRNPGTNFSQEFDVFLDEFKVGSGMYLNTLVSQLSGGDIDGDMRFVTRPNNKGNLLPSELFLNALNGSDFDYQFLPLLDTDVGRGHINRILSRYVGNDQQFVNNLTRHIATARTNGASRDALGRELNDYRNRVRDSNTQADVNDVMANVITDIQMLITRDDVFVSVVDEANKLVDRMVTDGIDMIIPPDAPSHERRVVRGKLDKMDNAADIMAYMGAIYSRSMGTGQEYFRQTGSWKYDYAKRYKQLVMGFGRDTHHSDLIQKTIAYWARLEDAGEHIEESIANQFSSYVEMRFYEELNPELQSNKIGGGLDPKVFEETFQKVYNEGVKLYNNALHKVGYDDRAKKLMGVITKGEIDFSNSGKRNDAFSALIKTFGDMYVSVFFDVSKMPEPYQMITLNEMYTDMVSYGGFDQILFPNMDEAANDFFSDMWKSYTTETEKIYRTAKKHLSDPNLRMTVEEAMRPENFMKANYILDAFQNGVDPEVFMYYEIPGVEAVLNSPYAEVIFNGTAEQKMNLQMSMSLGYKFARARMAYDAGRTNDAILFARGVRDGSALSDAIASQIVKGEPEYKFRLLDAFANPNIDIHTKFKAWEDMQVRCPIKENLYVSAIRTDSTRMGLSAISQRLVTMGNDINGARKHDYATLQHEAEEISKVFDGVSHNDANADDQLEEWLNDIQYSSNNNIAFTMILDGREFLTERAEKGTASKKSTAQYMQVALERRGIQTSYIAEASDQTRRMYVGDLLRNKYRIMQILYEGAEYEVFDMQGSDYKVNLSSLLSWCNEDVGPVGDRITYKQFCILIRSFPQVLNTLTSNMIQMATGSDTIAALVTTEKPSESFKDYIAKSNDDIASVVKRRARNRVGWRLFNNPEYYAALAQMVDIGNKSKTNEQLLDDLQSTHNRLVNQILGSAQRIREGGRAFREDIETANRRRMKFEAIDNVATALKNSMEASLSAVKASNYGFGIDTGFLVAQNSDLQGILNMSYTDALISDLASVTGGVNTEEYRIIRSSLNGLFQSQAHDEYVSITDFLDGEYHDEGVSILRSYTDSLMALVGTETYADHFMQHLMANNLLGQNDYGAVAGNVRALFNTIADHTTSSPAVYQQDIVRAINEMLHARARYRNRHVEHIDFTGLRELERKIREIYDRAGDLNTDTIDEIIQNMRTNINRFCQYWMRLGHNEITNEQYDNMVVNNETIVQRIENARVSIDGALMQNAVSRISSFGQVGINANAFTDANYIYGFLNDAIHEVAGDDTINTTYFDSEDSIVLPEVHMTDAATSYTAMSAIFDAATGMIGTNVGLNGSIVNTLHGFALVRHDVECNDPGTVITKQDLRRRQAQYYDMFIDVTHNGNTERRRLTCAMNWDTIPDDAEIRVFDPNHCRLGVCSKHSVAPDAPDSDNILLAFQEYLNILYNSQEDANLQLKKALNNVEQLVRGIEDEQHVRGMTVELSEHPDARTAVQAFMRDRRTVRQRLYHAMAQSLHNNRVRYTNQGLQAIASAMTSACRLNFVDADGNMSTLTIGLDELMHYSGAGTFENDVYNKAGKLVSIEMKFTTMEELNMKISSDIYNNRFTGRNGQPMMRDIYDGNGAIRVATRSIKDWSQWGTGNLNLGAYLRSGSIIKEAYNETLVPDNSPTSKQNMLRELTTRAAYTHYADGEKLDVVDDKSTDTVKKINKELFGGKSSDNDFLVTHINASGRFRESHNSFEGIQSHTVSTLNSINDKKPYRAINSRAAYMFANDDYKSIVEMLNDKSMDAWNYERILIPALDELGDMASNNQWKTVDVTVGRKGKDDRDNTHTEEFYVVDTRAVRDYQESLMQRFEYPTGRKNINDIVLVMYDSTGVCGLGDSPGLVSQEMNLNGGDDIEQNFDIKTADIPSGSYYCNENDLLELRDLLSSGNDREINSRIIYDTNNKNISNEAVREKLMAFYRNRASMGGRGFVSDPNLHDCITVYTTVRGGVRLFYPVFLTGNTNNSIDHIYSLEPPRNGTVKMHYRTHIDFENGVNLKMFVPHAAMKGVVRLASNDEQRRVPRIPGVVVTDDQGARRQFGNVVVMDYNAWEGRQSGRREAQFKENMYAWSRMIGASIRFQLNDNGEWVRNPNLSEWAAEMIDGNMQRIDKMFNVTEGDTDLWAAIAVGAKVLLEEDAERLGGNVQQAVINRRANIAIRKLAYGSVIRKNGVIMQDLLESYEFNDAIEYTDRIAGENEDKPGSVIRDVTLRQDRIRRKDLFNQYTQGIMDGIEHKHVIDLFHTMNSGIIQSFDDMRNPLIEMDQFNGKMPRMLRDGRMLFNVMGHNIYEYGAAVIPGTGDNLSVDGEFQGTAAEGLQMRIKRALTNGVAREDIPLFLASIRKMCGDPIAFTQGGFGYNGIRRDRTSAEYYVNSRNDPDPSDKRFQSEYDVTHGDDFAIDVIDGKMFHTGGRAALEKEIDKVAQTYKHVNLVFKDGEGNTVDGYWGSDACNALKARLESALRINGTLSDVQWSAIAKNAMGWSLDTSKHAEPVPITRFEETINELINAANDTSPNARFFIHGGRRGNRISISLLPCSTFYSIYRKSGTLQDLYPTYDDAVDAAMTEMETTWDDIAAITYKEGGIPGAIARTRQKMLTFQAMFCEKTHGMDIDIANAYGYIVDSMFNECTNDVLRAMMTDEEIRDLDGSMRRRDQEKARSLHLRQRSENRQTRRVCNEYARAGHTDHARNMDNMGANKFLANMESAIRLNAVANPFLIPGSYIETAGHTAILRAGIRHGIGPFSGESAVSHETVSQVAGIDSCMKFYKALVEAQMLGKEDEFLEGFRTAEDKEKLLDDLYGGRTKLEKFSDWVFTITSANSMFIKSQLEIAIGRMGVLAMDYGLSDQTFRPDGPDGPTMMEVRLKTDPLGWMMDVLSESSPSRMMFLRAMNTAQGSSQARENVVSILTRELFSNHPVVSFMSSSCVTPFYRYVTNKTGRVLNWVMPLSSINYLLVERLAGNPNLNDLGIERAQIYSSLRAAVIADAMHMSIPALAMLIAFGLTGALQPPEDKDKEIDYREWTFFGLRIMPEWWLTDALGPALPLACAMSCISRGEIRYDVLIQGMATVLMDNPLMKVTDIVELLTNQDAMLADWADEKTRYRFAIGGEPTAADKLLGMSSQFGLNFLGKFITPSFMKEIGRMATRYEKSYRTVFAEGVEGIDSNAGQTADTVKTDYVDAMVRQCTARNPVLGFIVNMFLQPNTSYTSFGSPFAANSMPNVEYTDPFEKYVSGKYSIMTTDENGNYVEKNDFQKQQVAMDVLATLESTDDMKALRESGFALDWQTRAYVSNVLWQTVNQANTEFYEWYNSSASDPNILGAGDYWSGREERNKAYQENQAYVSGLKSIYYDKLWSNEMKKGVQKYFRENTSYRMDNQGNWYNSGFDKATSIFGFKLAAGTLSDPEGTMGASGDWATPSAYNSEVSTGERALVAIPDEYDETPDFDEWGKLSENQGKTSSSGSSSSKSSGGYRRSGGGGGGGGGYRPNIYSRVPDSSTPNPTQSRGGNLQDPRYDYLRPGFQTKGSREATRRQDF